MGLGEETRMNDSNEAPTGISIAEYEGLRVLTGKMVHDASTPIRQGPNW